MIQILTDSTADIPEEICDELIIDTIPMYIQVDGKVYRDGIDIDAARLFDEISRTGVYPTTSAPSPGDFIKFLNRSEPSIYIGVSSQLSSTFRNAKLALDEMGATHIDAIDSRSFSTGYGQIVVQAAKWRNAGMGLEELGLKIHNLIERSRGIFILDTLDYLYHGGRCSSITHIVSSILKIRPFLNVQPDGTLGILKKVRGSRMNAVKALLNYFKQEVIASNINRIYITHYDCEDEVASLKQGISELGRAIEITVYEVGCALAVHSGPKPLGIAYIKE